MPNLAAAIGWRRRRRRRTLLVATASRNGPGVHGPGFLPGQQNRRQSQHEKHRKHPGSAFLHDCSLYARAIADLKRNEWIS